MDVRMLKYVLYVCAYLYLYLYLYIYIYIYICMSISLHVPAYTAFMYMFHASMDMHTCMALALPCLALQYTARHEVTIRYIMYTYRAEQSIVLHYLHMYLPLTPGAESRETKACKPASKKLMLDESQLLPSPSSAL